MGVKFTGSDIAEMGIQIEKNGKEYYDEVLRCSKSEKAKQIFKFLGQEEVNHVVFFEKLLSSLEKEEAAESYSGEYYEYMKNLSALHVFTKKGKGLEAACKIKSDKEALKTAVDFEKDSILFYYEMKNFISTKDKKVLDEIIKEEQAHLSKLMVLLKSI
ncbi:MAG: hypothetical protein A2231_03230 [Candidatus Firestonebacteria bacterium RIFOXYA2_FULL_40_8]|nr:MAG: hypothetical protein A2231_03230 [Candidatus Firestonebacteria bacterium RIFOXYA2_FULL_40_8]